MPTSTRAPLAPAAVSRVIRETVMRPLPSGTRPSVKGVRVQRSVLGEVQVSVDLGTQGKSERVAGSIGEALTAAGYAVTPSALSPAILYVGRS